MCLLISSKDGKKVPEEHLRYAFKTNSDGAGYAWADGKTAWRRRGFFSVEALLKDYEKDCAGKPHMVHLRWATSGSKTEINCHPFDVGGQWFMGHNGVFHGLDQWKYESDTAAYARSCLTQILNKDPRCPVDGKNHIKFMEMVKRTTTFSKLVFLNGAGETVIIHEDKGEWKDGIWYSNKMYAPLEYHYPNYGGGGQHGRYQSTPNEHWITRNGKRWDNGLQKFVDIEPPHPKDLAPIHLLPPARPQDDDDRFTIIPSHAIQPCECCNFPFNGMDSWHDADHEDIICTTCKNIRLDEEKEDRDFRALENSEEEIAKFLGDGGGLC